MYYSLHDYKQILKMQKNILFQKTITLPAINWVGVIDEEKLTAAKTELSTQGIVVNTFEFVTELPEVGTVNIGYIMYDVCYMYNSTWNMVYEFDSDAPYTQTVKVSGITPTNIVLAAADMNIDNMLIVSRCQILATHQDTDTITFTAFEERPERNEDSTLNENVVMNLVIGGEGRKDGGNIV